MPQNYMILNE